MSAYKQFTTKDIVITPFSANKGFRFKGNKLTASNVGVEVYFGTQPPSNKLIYPTSQNFVWLVEQASSISGSQNATGFVNKLNTNSVYSSVMQLYYSNYFGSMSGSLVATSSLIRGLEGPQNNPFAEYNNLNIGLSGSNNTPIGAIKSPQYDNYLSSTTTQTRTALLGEDISWSGQGLYQNYCTVISIPSKLWGNNIEPQSFSINYSYGTLLYNVYDDGDGNLLTSGQDNTQTWENQYIGNIAYEHGLAVITPVTSSLIPSSQQLVYSNAGFQIPNLGAWVLAGQNGFNVGSRFNTNLTIGWSSSVTLYEHQYKCVVRENEYGYSLNPSILMPQSTQNSGPLNETINQLLGSTIPEPGIPYPNDGTPGVYTGITLFTGYSTPGTGGILSLTIGSGGELESITVTTPGEGYIVGSIMIIDMTQVGGTGFMQITVRVGDVIIVRPVGNTYENFATGSYFSPYITTVGLYDNDQNLLAIGKLSSPTKVPMNADLEIQVSFDSL